MKNKKIYLLVILISIVLAVEGWSLAHKPRIDRGSLQQEEMIKKDPVEKIPKIRKVPEREHQEKLERESPPEESFPIMLSLDTLELELLGTAIGNIKDPIAFIKNLKTGRQGIYRLGNLIKEAKIVEIAMGEVVFEEAGQRSVLRLGNRGRAWCKIDQETPLPVIETISEGKIVLSKSGVLKEANNIYKSLQGVKIKPHYQSDKVVGLMVDGITQGSIIEEAGIRNKDVIKSVNSQRIDSYQKALQVFRKVRNQPEIKVNLLREGQDKTLLYQIDL